MNSVSRLFGNHRAIDNLSFRLASGEIVGLLGHNGAGKTTTVRMLAGLLKPDAGQIEVMGINPQVDGVAVRRQLGVSTETPAVDDRLTGQQGLELFGAMHGVDADELPRRVHDLLEKFGLLDAAHRKVGGYSKGMRQRLALARAILHDPKLLLLDEPTSGLDPVAAREVLEQLQAWRGEGRSIVLCTHDLRHAQSVCDRVIVLEHGRLVAEGSPRELAASLGGRVRVHVQVPQADAETARMVLTRQAGWQDVKEPGPAPALGDVRITGHVEQQAAISDAIAALVGVSVKVHAVEQDAPTLEDVYFALHGDSGHAESDHAESEHPESEQPAPESDEPAQDEVPA